jgi:hypothetical protein
LELPISSNAKSITVNKTPLDLARAHRHKEIADLLEAAGAVSGVKKAD